MKTLQPTEKQIQDSIIEYLRRKKWYVQRLNSGKMAYQYKGKTSFMNLADAGTPDIMAFNSCACCVKQVGAHIVFIEVKRPGKKATPLQLAKMEELTSYGARCIVATSIDDLASL